MQEWEYRTVILGRRFDSRSGWSDFSGRLNGQSIDLGTFVTSKMQEFGEEGWELTSTFPISSPPNEDLGGATTAVCFIFKRPKD